MATALETLTARLARRKPYRLIIVVGVVALLLGGLIGYAAKPGGAEAPGVLASTIRSLVVNDEGLIRPQARVVATTLGTAVTLYLLSLALVWWATRNARRWTAPLLKVRGQGGPELLMNSKLKDATLRERLRQQLNEVNARADHHFAVFVDFYKWYYSSIGTFSVAGLVAAIALFFISNRGWSQSEDPLIAVFVISTAAAAFYRSVVNVYRQAENIADNKQLYRNYLALENVLRSFCAVGESEVDGQKLTAAGFVAHVDRKLAEFGNIAVGFDATKVESYQGLFDAVDKAKIKQQADAAQDSDLRGNPVVPGRTAGANGNGRGDLGAADLDGIQIWDAEHPEQEGVYEAAAGDTLEVVSGKVGRSQEEVAKNNPQYDLSGEIPAGLKLYIPPAETGQAEPEEMGG